MRSPLSLSFEVVISRLTTFHSSLNSFLLNLKVFVLWDLRLNLWQTQNIHTSLCCFSGTFVCMRVGGRCAPRVWMSCSYLISQHFTHCHFSNPRLPCTWLYSVPLIIIEKIIHLLFSVHYRIIKFFKAVIVFASICLWQCLSYSMNSINDC